MDIANLPKLNFLCFGVGAIGTYIGGSLALIGQRVVFLDRSDIAQEVRKNGLSLQLHGEERKVPEPEIAVSIDEALQRGPFDVAIIAVKSFDTQGLLETLKPYSIALPPFLCLQNGVENEALIAAVLGEEKVIAGSVTTAIARRGTGSIVLERLRGIGVASEHHLAQPLVAILSAAGLRGQLYEDPRAMKWSKMLTNLLGNASSAILNLPPAKVFANPQAYELEVRQIREALRVMNAASIRVIDLPGTPVRTLASLMRLLPPGMSRPLAVQFLGKGRGGKMPSFHIDLHSGRGKSEVDYLNGAVVRMGEQLKISTPVNRLLRDVLLELTNGEIPLDRYDNRPDLLLKRLEEGEPK